MAQGVPVAGEVNEAVSKRIPEPLPKHPTADDVYFIDGAWAPAAITAQEKRLTIAECAAEFWASHGEANAYMTGNPRLWFSRRAALRRFATLPHYDEEAT